MSDFHDLAEEAKNYRSAEDFSMAVIMGKLKKFPDATVKDIRVIILPNGKGVSPTNHRGIVNHWEVIVDAGYLPSSNIFKLKHSPDMIVAGAINKGWRRWSGEASYEIRDLSKPNADFINKRLKQHFDNSGLRDAHIDVWSEGKYYNFDKATWDKSNMIFYRS